MAIKKKVFEFIYGPVIDQKQINDSLPEISDFHFLVEVVNVIIFLLLHLQLLQSLPLLDQVQIVVSKFLQNLSKLQIIYK